MGLFRRKKSEAAAAPSAPEAPAPAPEPVGQMVEGAGPAGFDLGALSSGNAADIGSVFSNISQAMQTGQVQVHINPGQQNTVNVGDPNELGERMKEIMRKHGIDPDTGTQHGDVDVVALQAEMMQALGGNLPGGGASESPK